METHGPTVTEPVVVKPGSTPGLGAAAEAGAAPKPGIGAGLKSAGGTALSLAPGYIVDWAKGHRQGRFDEAAALRAGSGQPSPEAIQKNHEVGWEFTGFDEQGYRKWEYKPSPAEIFRNNFYDLFSPPGTELKRRGSYDDWA